MWYDDERMMFRQRRANRRRRVREEPVLMVNARLSEQKRDRRHRLGSVVVVTVALAGVLWGVLVGARFLGNVLFSGNSDFAITTLDLASDGKLQPWHIREYAGVKEGMNLFAIDIDGIREALESVPVVSRVTVRRQLPGTLVVRVTERVPLARIGRGEEPIPLAVDREGYVLGPSSHSPALPAITGIQQPGLKPGTILSGPDIRDALTVLEICDTTRLSQYIRISSISVEDAEYLDLHLADGERVPMAREGIEWRLRKLAAVLQANRERGLTPVFIDATGDSNFAVRYR